MISRKLTALADGGWRRIAVSILLGLLVTATYAAQGFALAKILTDVFAGSEWSAILPMVAAVAALQAVRAALIWAREINGIMIAGAVKQRVRDRLYRRLLDLGPGYTTGTRTGEAQSTIVDAVESLEKYYSSFLPQFAVTVIGGTLLAAYVTSVDAVVGAIVACGAVLVLASLIGSRYVMRAAMKRWFHDYKTLYAESLDAVQGMTTLKAFNAHERRREALHVEGDRFAKSSIGLMVAASIPYGLVGLAASAGIALSAGVGAMRLAGGHLSVSELFILLLLARECFRPLTDLQNAFHFAYMAPAAAEGIFTLLDARPVLRERAGRAPIGERGFVASIAFDDVTFRYRPDGAPALDGLTFAVAPGETVALVGRSGAGKTTIVSLLLRFFDTDSGTVLVGGSDVRGMPVEDLRGRIAVVAQDTFLFHASVAENMRVARPGASPAELERAARAARAHDFIAALPDGYDTVIGERGLKLSGGERQRLSVARALLKDAPILVLDEATSSVDAASEGAIQAALDALTAGRTTLVIAHRLSTVRNADRIIVLDRGRPVESGVPAELLGQSGAYARLVAAQGGRS